MSFSLHKPRFQRFDAFSSSSCSRAFWANSIILSAARMLIFSRLLSRCFTRVSEALTMLALRRLSNARSITLAFQFLPEGVVAQPLVNGGLIDPGAPASLLH